VKSELLDGIAQLQEMGLWDRYVRLEFMDSIVTAAGCAIIGLTFFMIGRLIKNAAEATVTTSILTQETELTPWMHTVVVAGYIIMAVSVLVSSLQVLSCIPSLIDPEAVVLRGLIQ